MSFGKVIENGAGRDKIFNNHKNECYENKIFNCCDDLIIWGYIQLHGAAKKRKKSLSQNAPSCKTQTATGTRCAFAATAA